MQITDTGLIFDSTSVEGPLRVCSFTSLLRLNSGGEILGSDDDSEDDDVMASEIRSTPSESERGTNLGDVLRRAREGGP